MHFLVYFICGVLVKIDEGDHYGINIIVAAVATIPGGAIGIGGDDHAQGIKRIGSGVTGY